MEKNFLLDLMSTLDQAKSRKQVNEDIRQLENTINKLRITGTFARGNTKQELNAYIKSLQAQLNHVKLNAKIDDKNLKREIEGALNKLSFKDIDLLKFDGSKTKLKMQKVIADTKAYVEKNPVSIGINYEIRRNKLDNDLTAYLKRNTKIEESSVLLKEADRVRTLIGAINDKKSLREATDAFQLYKSSVASVGFNTKSTTDKIKDMFSHITKLGSIFSVTSLAVNNFTKSMKTLRQNDTILTEISKTSELTKQQLKELGDEAFKTAGKYGQLSSNYLLAVQEMARSGYEDTSKELGELSLLTQSAGDMTADNANNYLLATDAAYKYSGSVEKLNAALDGANYISNRNSASLTDIADATRVSASFAANAGVAIDELTAAEATMIATTKRSGSEIGRAFRSIVLNLQQVSGEFDGEVIDEEQLKKVESRCHSMGVELEYMKDGIATLRNPMEVLKDLAGVYNSLPDSSADKQGLISDLGGKYHANALSALLSRWDMYEKMLGEFSQGTGSALEEAEKTADSWEGRLNSLQNSFDSFINKLTNKDAVKSGITFFDRLIQGAEGCIDIFGEIPTVLTAVNASMVTLNKDYGITQLVNPETKKLDIQGNLFGIDFSATKNLKKHFSEAEDAIAKWNKELLKGKVDINDFDHALAKNSTQFKAYLQTTSKDAPASLAGYKASLNAAGISTDALRLKTILLNSVISMGIGAAIQAAVQGITYLIQRQENLRQATEEAANAYKESASSIEDYASRYEELRKALIAAKGNEEQTYSIRKQLLELQTELNGKFGEEYGKINLVTDAYKDQTEAIKALNKETAQTFLNENKEGIDRSEREMMKDRHYNLSYTGIAGNADKGKAVREIAEKYKEQGITLLDEYGDGSYLQFSIHLNADAQSAFETINAFENDLRDKAKELGDEHMFDDVLDVSSDSLNKVRETIENYGDIYKQALTAKIVSDDDKSKTYGEALKVVEAYNEAVLRSENPYDDQNVMRAKEKLDALKESIQGNGEELGKYSAVFDEVFEQADTRLLEFNETLKTDSALLELANDLKGLSDVDLQALDETAGENESFDKLKEAAAGYKVNVDELTDALIRLGYIQGDIQDSALSDTDLTPSININGVVAGIEKQVKPVMDAIQSAWADAYDEEGVFKIDPSKALDAVNQVKSAIDSINSEEGLGIQIDTSSIEELANVLTDTSATEDEVRQAYSNIADAVMNEFLPAMDGMDDAHIRVMQTFLEGLGIMNAEELIIQQLGYTYETYTAAKQVAAQAGIDLANATVEDVMMFAEESTAAEKDKIALLDYYQYKIIASGATIDTNQTIVQLLAEYEQLGINCEKLKEYLGLHGAGAGSKVDLKHKGYSSSTEGYDTGANTKPKLPEIPKGIDDRRAKAAKSASKAAKEEADVMSELNSEMDKLQSAYKSLCDIKDTYNKYGKITVDQYQELTNMGFNFLANLVDENGQLGLNASAFERLAQAKLQEMQIQMARNATDTINGLKTETEAVEYLTFANEKLRDAALGAAEAQLESAVAAAKMRGEQQGAAAEQIYKGYQASKQMAGNVDFFFDPAALEKEEKENSKEDKTDKLLEAYNKEKAVLEHMFSMGQISNSEYYNKLLALAKQYFEGDPEHQEQLWDAEESYHDYMESIKTTIDWIEIFLDNLAKKANALIDKASKFISWSKKNAMINRAVKATDKQITGQTNAYAYYAEKARKVGLNNAYIDKIQNGTLTMEDMQNEALSGKIEKYQEWLIV